MLIDGLQCGHFDREAFDALRRGNVGAVTVTCGFWEDTTESLDSIGRWRDLCAANADIVEIARSAADVRRIADAGRMAIILGFQNTDLFSGRIRLVEMFAELGVRAVQLTYNNQNAYAGSCYEAADSGLSRHGRALIKEMNRAGILIDLSHVGNGSTLDAVKFSAKPVAITHANADSLFPHKRNKTDDVLLALRDNGGVIGCATYRNITGDHYCATIENWCTMVLRTVEIAGIDHVAVGTDRSHNFTKPDYDWMRMGRWSREIDYGAASAAKPGKAAPPDWFPRVEDIGRIEPGLAAVGFTPEEVAKIAHGNWLRVYQAVWGS